MKTFEITEARLKLMVDILTGAIDVTDAITNHVAEGRLDIRVLSAAAHNMKGIGIVVNLLMKWDSLSDANKKAVKVASDKISGYSHFILENYGAMIRNPEYGNPQEHMAFFLWGMNLCDFFLSFEEFYNEEYLPTLGEETPATDEAKELTDSAGIPVTGNSTVH